MDNKASHPLILFSGGLDSTYLLYSNAKRVRKITTLYVVGAQSARKSIAEISARDKILNKVRELTECEIIDRQVRIPLDWRYHQGVQWLLAACSLDEVREEQVTEVMAAYVKDDSIDPVLDLALAAWPAIVKLTTGATEIAIPELRFPLRQTTKEEIWENIPLEIRQLIWVCESPRSKGGNGFVKESVANMSSDVPWNSSENIFPCGTCHPCQRLHTTLGGAVLRKPPEPPPLLKDDCLTD